jgi:DNA polymerase III alpha subunit (gram-positive type)
MSEFKDCMIDLETTSTCPEYGAIIQLAAVKFDYETRAIDTENMFDRCLRIAPYRFWDEDTRAWWNQQQPHILKDIYRRMEDPETVLRDFVAWVGPSGARLWAKPATFEGPFLQSYFRQFQVGSPFHYRDVIDLNSFLRGHHNSVNIPHIPIAFDGDAHNALHDVIHQIAQLFAGTEKSP